MSSYVDAAISLFFLGSTLPRSCHPSLAAAEALGTAWTGQGMRDELSSFLDIPTPGIPRKIPPSPGVQARASEGGLLGTKPSDSLNCHLLNFCGDGANFWDAGEGRRFSDNLEVKACAAHGGSTEMLIGRERSAGGGHFADEVGPRNGTEQLGTEICSESIA